MNHRPPPPSLDDALAALANEQRRRMVEVVAVRPTTVTDLAATVALTLPAIHRHIRVLEGARLVRRRKSGRTNVLTLDRSGLRLVHDWVTGFSPWWGTDAETLTPPAAGRAAPGPTPKE